MGTTDIETTDMGTTDIETTDMGTTDMVKKLTCQEIDPSAVAPASEICVICHDELGTDNVMVQWCGHKFHNTCMQDWRDVARRSERHCPFRCETSQMLAQPILVLTLIAFCFISGV